MAKQTYTSGQVLSAAQMTTLQANDYNQTVSAKVASYTLVAADAGTRITMSNASATTITVNTGLFAAGDTLYITNIGAGVSTITAGTATVSTASSLALAQYDSGVLYFTSAGVAIWQKYDGAAAASSDDNFTLLNAGGTALTGSGTVTVSFTAVNKLLIQIDTGSSSSDSEFRIRFNSDTGNNYGFTSLYQLGDGSVGFTSSTAAAQIDLGRQSNAGANIYTVMQVNGAKTTGVKPISYSNQGSTSYIGNGFYKGSSAITSVSAIAATGNWDNGTIYIYGA
jgi:hypothetical protein